jgi:hypothetical protein
VEFKDGTKFFCDVVLMCTGYDGNKGTNFKFSAARLAPELKFLHPRPRKLYARTIDPDVGLAVGYVGFHRPAVGSIPQLSEMTARYYAGLVTGKFKLPTREKMLESIAAQEAFELWKFPFDAERVASLTDFHKLMSDMGDRVGCSPMQHFWQLCFTDPRLWWALLTKQHNAFHYRLFDSNGSRSSEYDVTRALLLAMPASSAPVRLFAFGVWACSWLIGTPTAAIGRGLGFRGGSLGRWAPVGL